MSKDVVLLGRTEARMREVLALLVPLADVTLHPTFREAEAIERIRSLPGLRVVLLGGAVDGPTRERIRALLAAERPDAVTSEPGVGYPYSDAGIVDDVRRKTR